MERAEHVPLSRGCASTPRALYVPLAGAREVLTSAGRSTRTTTRPRAETRPSSPERWGRWERWERWQLERRKPRGGRGGCRGRGVAVALVVGLALRAKQMPVCAARRARARHHVEGGRQVEDGLWRGEARLVLAARAARQEAEAQRPAERLAE